MSAPAQARSGGIVWKVADIQFDPAGIGEQRSPPRRQVAATLVVMMRPAVFAALATPLSMPRPSPA